MTDSDIGQEIFDFRSCLFGKMSGNSAKRLINWHTGWLGEMDEYGDLVGDWAQYSEFRQRAVQVLVLRCGKEVQMVQEPV